MKNVITYLKALWSLLVGSRRNDVEFDRRLTVGSPSGFTINWTLKLVSVLAILLSIGVGRMWGANVDSGSAPSFTDTSGDLDTYISYDAAQAGGTNAPIVSNSKIRLYRKNKNTAGLGSTLTVSASGGAKITSITFTISSSLGYSVSVDGGAAATGTGTSITKSSINATSVTLQNNSTSQMDVSRIQVTYTAPTPCTITWHVNGSTTTAGSPTINSTIGSKVTTLPTAPLSAACDGSKVFVGWTETAIVGTTNTVPSDLFTTAAGAPTLTQTATHYYAVFATASVDAATATFGWESADDATKWTLSNLSAKATYNTYKSSGSYAGSNGSSTTAYIQFNNKISPSAISCKYTKATTNTNSSSKFIIQTSSDGSSWTDKQTGKTMNNVTQGTFETLSWSGTLSDVYVRIYLTTTATARVIDDVSVSYSSTTYSNYATTCCTELGSINGSVNWSNGTRATLSWDDIANVASWAVTAIDNTTSSAVAAGNITTPNDDGDTYSCVVSNLTAGHNYTFTIAATAESGYCDKSQEITATAPNITTSASSITGLEYIDGNGPSEAKSFTVSAAGLTGNLTVAAPTNFQVSTTSSTSGFGNSATLTPVSGSLTNATVWVRLTAGLSENTYGSASTYVTISGGGAANKNVSVQGLVSAACTAPTITAQPSGATYNLNTPATALSVTATGESLTYQWYSNTANNNTSGTIINGATNRTYTPATTTKGTIYYYCVVSSGACHTASNTATITVRTPSIATASPSVIAFGDKKVGGTYTATFTISATNLAYNTGLTLTLGGTARAYYSIDKTSIAQTSAGTVASTTVTVTYTPTAAGVHGAGANTYVTISSEGATSTSVTLSGTGKWEVTWKASGSDDQTTLVGNGERPTFPSAPSSCDGTSTTFIGWTKTAWTGKQTKTYVDGLTTDATKVHTSNSTMSTVTANGTTYHAVWAEGDIYWGRMTSSDLSSLAAGSKLVIVAVAQGYVLKNDLTNSNSVPSETAGVISPSSDLIWELAGSSGAWNIKSGSNTIGTQYNSCAGAGNGVVLLANNNHQSYSIGSSSHGTNEFYIKDNACDNGVLTKVSKYDDFRIVNVSSYSSAADAALKLYTQKGSYSNFMTTCCDKNITLSEPVITDVASSGATITFDKTSPVATCEGETTVTATLTLPAGYEATALNFSGGSVRVSPEITLPVTTTTEYTLTFAQNTNATLTTTATIAAKTATAWTWKYNGGEIPDPLVLYVGINKQLDVTYTPADLLNTQKNYTVTKTDAHVAQGAKANAYYSMRGAAGVTTETNSTVTFSLNGLSETVNVVVKPQPQVHFVDIVHGESFADVGPAVVSYVATFTQPTPTHIDLVAPGSSNTCEDEHLHLIGWIYSEWSGVADYMGNTSSKPNTAQLIAATVGTAEGFAADNTPCFFAAGDEIDTEVWNGKTFYAVWSKIE